MSSQIVFMTPEQIALVAQEELLNATVEYPQSRLAQKAQAELDRRAVILNASRDKMMLDTASKTTRYAFWSAIATMIAAFAALATVIIPLLGLEHNGSVAPLASDTTKQKVMAPTNSSAVLP